MRIIFMGTPLPAAKVLSALLSAGHEIVCVVTQPDRKKGRGQKIALSPVAELAAANNLKIEKPEKVKDVDFIARLKGLAPDMIVVVAYGEILPKVILDIPKYGCINVHASLLPKYRGAAPVQRALLNGEIESGITIMQLDEGLDTGPILSQEKVAIALNDTTTTFMDKLFVVGARLLLDTINKIVAGKIIAAPQNNSLATYAPILRKEEGVLDFRKSAHEIYNMVRAFNPWPGAYTFYKGKILKIYKVQKDFFSLQKAVAPGEVIDIIKGRGIVVAAEDLGILLEEVQLEGARKISANGFAIGQRITVGSILPS